LFFRDLTIYWLRVLPFMEDSFLSALEAVGKFVFIYQKHRG
jgi:hypothetical protein